MHSVPVAHRPKRRRFWPWSLLALLLVLIVWWFYPKHYRIRDLAAKLDQTEPGWRYDDLNRANPVPPPEQNAFVFLKPLEAELPTGLNGLRFKSTLFTPGENKGNIPVITSNAELTGEYTELLQQTVKLRKQLEQLTSFPAAHYQELSWYDQAVKQLPLSYPRLDEWYCLLVLHVEDAQRGQSASEVEKRLKLLFHHQIQHRIPNSNYTTEVAKDFIIAVALFERALAQFPLSDATLVEIDRLLSPVDWLQIQKQGWRRMRASSYERCNSLLEHWYELRQASKIPKLEKLFLSMTWDDYLESFTTFTEYYHGCLTEPTTESRQDFINTLLARLKPYTESPSDIQMIQLWKRLRYKARTGAYYAISRHETEHNEFLAAQAQVHLARTAIALERHRRKTGQWATSWEELVPKYLPAPLEDTIQPGSPVRWSPVPQGLSLQAGPDNGSTSGTQKVLFHLIHRSAPSTK